MSEQQVEPIKLIGRTFLRESGLDSVDLLIQEDLSIWRDADDEAALDLSVEVRVGRTFLRVSGYVVNKEDLIETMGVLNKLVDAFSVAAQGLETFGRKHYPDLYVQPTPEVTQEEEEYQEGLTTADVSDVANDHSKF